MKLEITITNGFLEYLKDFETADSAYLAAQDAMCNSVGFDDDEWNALKSACESARSNREHYAVVLSRFLVSVKGWISFEADAPADAPVDTSVDSPADAPADVPVDVSENALADVPEDAPEDAPADVPENAPEDSPADIFPVMSAKCKLCPSCVDGRCFFVPDIYDSVFPCQSPAWDDFFKSGGSRSPAPRARASPL